MKKIIEKLRKLDKGTICRTILQVCAYINQFVAIIGMSTFASNPVYQWISFGVTLVVTAVTYWYNNDWSSLALLTRDIFDMLEDGKIDKQELEDFLEKHKK